MTTHGYMGSRNWHPKFMGMVGEKTQSWGAAGRWVCEEVERVGEGNITKYIVGNSQKQKYSSKARNDA